MPQIRDKNDEQVLKSKLSLYWTGVFKVFLVGPFSFAPDVKPVGDMLLYLDVLSGLRVVDTKGRVSVM